MKLLYLFLGRCPISSEYNSHSLAETGSVVPAGLLAWESRQPPPFLRVPEAPREGEGEEDESPLSSEEAGVNTCCHAELRGWLRGRGEPRLRERRRKAVQGFDTHGDMVWLTCSEAWLRCTDSRMMVPVLKEVGGKRGFSGTWVIKGKGFEVF